MNKDSDGLASYFDGNIYVAQVEAQYGERAVIVRFLRGYLGMEVIADRIEKGEHHALRTE